MGVPLRASFVNQVPDRLAELDELGQPVLARSYLGPAGCAGLYFGAAVGAPLGEWRSRALPGSPSRAAGWAALAPPGWASWDTGRQLATQGGGPWSPRAPRLNRSGPAITGRVSPIGNRGWAGPGVKTARHLLNSSLLATLGLGAAPVFTCARRVEHRSPRPRLARRAYRAGRGPFPLPLTGRFSTGAQACSYLTSGRPWRGASCTYLFAGLGRCCGGRARVEWGSVLGRSCHADRVRSSSSSYASQQFSIHLRYPATLSNS